MSPKQATKRRTCDIVMKGGITSGVVYPRAIATLAGRFTFKNIGGTSAGAIAAAASAAAEHRRAQTGDESGFDQLAELPRLLGEEVGPTRRTRLFRFFQPCTGTRRLFEVLTFALRSQDRAALLLEGLGHYRGWALAGGLPGLGLVVAAAVNWQSLPLGWLWLVAGLGVLAAGTAGAVVAGIVRDVIRELPRNGFGLCTGFSAADETEGPGDAMGEPLTVWLTRYLNEVAGLSAEGEPLTFGHLWGTRDSDPEQAPREVNLEMMTTNLTHGRPYRLPFRDDPDLRENQLFYFRPDEFLKLFPRNVVQHMIDHPRGHDGNSDRIARRNRLKGLGYHPMPAPADLPVVVATRMSLSFPILLSAVPLHAIDYHVFGALQQPERCWFSDGGMCSNFSIHFFDAALPRRPTFSIDLTEKPAGTTGAGLRPEMPSSNGAGMHETWNRFDTHTPAAGQQSPAPKPDLQKLIGFFGAMIRTMQNWTDTTQGRLPGYRDRIVKVPLTPDEGGLNLEMPPARISALSERGKQAAEVLIQRFGLPTTEETMTWDNHRWIRLRSYLASLEKSLNQLVNACDKPENGDCGYTQWLNDLNTTPDDPEDDSAPSYPMNSRQLAAARETLAKLHEIRDLWAASPAAGKAPRPRPVLRPRAQI